MTEKQATAPQASPAAPAPEGFSAFAHQYHERMFPGRRSTLRETDPGFVRALDNWAFDDVVRSDATPDALRFKVILAALIGSGAADEFRVLLPAALNFGVTPSEAKEIIYQAFPYLGIGRAYPFLMISNEVFRAQGIALPATDDAQALAGTRAERGRALQIQIFGDGMADFEAKGPAETRRIRRWLVENCFGDYYARRGLPVAERELMTFCFLAAQGGCDPQVESHAAGNLHIGNSHEKLLNAVAQMLPFIGYPRSLNAIAAIDRACKAARAKDAAEGE